MSGRRLPRGTCKDLKEQLKSCPLLREFRSPTFIECPCLYSYENSPVCCPLVVLDTTSNLKAELSDYDSEPGIRFMSHTLLSTPCRWFWTGLTTALCQEDQTCKTGCLGSEAVGGYLGLAGPHHVWRPQRWQAATRPART